jgi:3-oxoacyl-[acyl-carrier protein] reductase
MSRYGLAGRAALVTGGTSGIGRACVELLAAEGMRVAFTGRDEARGSAVAEATGALFLRCDHRDREASDRAVERAVKHGGGRLDLLVNNAGLILRGPLATTPEEAFRELVDVNLTAAFRVARACFSAMRASGGGSLVHIASDVGLRPSASLPAYSLTKAGLVMVSELLADEGAPHGIRSNAVCPGDVLPGMQATPAGREEDAERPSAWEVPPSGRFPTGADVAAVVAWLASDDSAHVSGASIRVDGAAGAAFRPSDG